MSDRLQALVEALDPRVHVRTRQRLDEVRDTTRELARSLELIDIRTQQLLTLERVNWEQRRRLTDLERLLDRETIRTHVQAAVERAPLATDPFPHFVVENWLPDAVYRAVLQAIPPPVFFADKPRHKQQLGVPPAVVPEYSRQVWTFIADFVVRDVFGPAVVCKLASSLDAYVASFCPAPPAEWRGAVPMHVSDGRLMVRRPGYTLEPHRDPRWGFITCLAYLGREGDTDIATYGTRLYRVRTHEEPPDETVFYVKPEECELVRTVPFEGNKVLVFLNSHGAHGASIPADAQPPDLERYLYQFRIGPDTNGVSWFLARMSEAQRRQWAGLKTERAGY